MRIGIFVGVLAAIIIAIILIWFASCYNSFVKLTNTCKEAYATMDVYLKKRFDLIPNLVETIKGASNYEQSTLQKVIDARSRIESAGSTSEKLEGENQLTSSLRSIFALSESYPDLKANQNYNDLMEQLRRIEEDIANSRKYYNAVVKRLNNKVEMFPSNIVAAIFHYETQPMFEITSEERENVKVQF